jgi:hypothetical protein
MKFYVYGLGALGSNLLVQLAKQYGNGNEFVGIDYDTIEDRNIGTQAYFKEMVRQPKAKAMTTILQRYGKIKYQAFNKKIEKYEDVIVPEPEDIIIDCFDNSASRKILKSTGEDNILHVGFSPHFTAEIIWNKEYDVPGDPDKEIDICELTSATSFIGFVVNFTALVIDDFLINRERKNYLITNKWNIKKL